MTRKMNLAFQIKRWEDFISCFTEIQALEFIFWHSETILSSDRIEWTMKRRSDFNGLLRHTILAVIGMYRLFPQIKEAAASNKQLPAIVSYQEMLQSDDSLENHKQNIYYFGNFYGKKGLEASFEDIKRQLLDRFWSQDDFNEKVNPDIEQFKDFQDNKIQSNLPPGDQDSGEVLFAAKQVFALLLDIVDIGDVLIEQD